MLYVVCVCVYMPFQTAFTLVFFCAFHEFIRQMLEKHRPNHDTTDGEMPLIPLHAKGT